jgi:hypothetical protein
MFPQQQTPPRAGVGFFAVPGSGGGLGKDTVLLFTSPDHPDMQLKLLLQGDPVGWCGWVGAARRSKWRAKGDAPKNSMPVDRAGHEIRMITAQFCTKAVMSWRGGPRWYRCAFAHKHVQIQISVGVTFHIHLALSGII